MVRKTGLRRRQVLYLMSGTSAVLAAGAIAAPPVFAAPVANRFGNDALTIEIDSAMRTRLVVGGRALTSFSDSETLLPAKGVTLAPFVLTEQGQGASKVAGLSGKTHSATGVSADGIEKTVEFTFDPDRPGIAAIVAMYRNIGRDPVSLRGWRNAAHSLTRGPRGLWTFAGSSHADRRDWIQPAPAGFEQRNYMGMNASDYGGGTPVVDIWRPDAGLAVGHLELTPELVALPVTSTGSETSIALESDQPFELLPGSEVATLTTFVAAHTGDCFAPLAAYREIMAGRGLTDAFVPASAYEAMWCAWGYERNFNTAQVVGTLPKVKELGIEWAVLDDGWQTAEGDWNPDPEKFPRGDADMIEFVDQIRSAGLRPRLWLAPLAVDPGTDLLHDHADMLLLDENGAVNDVTWWNAFTLCPAYQPTIDHCTALVRKIIGEWGYEGLKLDGQHLNGVPPCHNPAHNHAYPEEASEKLPAFWQAVHEAATSINPDAILEFCPCGTSFAFHSLPYMNQVPASDPLSSWQIRTKGKTTKALMGRSAPYSGDHVELSDGGTDFASAVGIGGVVSTKFTWPRDTDNPSGELPPGGYVLTPDKERHWRKWISLYQEHDLARGAYRGELYDIGFDRPETHAIDQNGRSYFAFYADEYSGPVELRGLAAGRHRVTNIASGKVIGTVDAATPNLAVTFKRHLILQAERVGA